MTRQSLEAVGEVLHRGGERQAAQLGQAAPADRWPETKRAQLSETIPWGHAALVLLEGVVPCLGGPAEMVGSQPSALRCGRALSAEKLVALVEPVKRVV